MYEPILKEDERPWPRSDRASILKYQPPKLHGDIESYGSKKDGHDSLQKKGRS